MSVVHTIPRISTATHHRFDPLKESNGTSGAGQRRYWGEPTLLNRINPIHIRSEPATRCVASSLRSGGCFAVAARQNPRPHTMTDNTATTTIAILIATAVRSARL